MKNVLLMCILFLSTVCNAAGKEKTAAFDISAVPLKDGAPYYERIVTLDSSITKDMIYQGAKSSMISYFRDAKQVIQQDDKEAGTLIGRGLTYFVCNTKAMGIKVAVKCRMWFIFDISAKDGKYRLRVYSHEIETYSTYTNSWIAGTFNESYNSAVKHKRFEFIEAFHMENLSILQTFDDGIRKGANETKVDEW